MALDIVWTQTAKETYIYIVDYLEEFWGQKHVNNFIKKTEKVFKLIVHNPNMFPSIYEDDSVRKAILHKNCSFLYRISEFNIELLAFWDTRQEPFL